MKLPCLRVQQTRRQLRKEDWMMLVRQTDPGTDTWILLMTKLLLSLQMACSSFWHQERVQVTLESAQPGLSCHADALTCFQGDQSFGIKSCAMGVWIAIHLEQLDPMLFICMAAIVFARRSVQQAF